MPGIDTGAPERTDSSSGWRASPKRASLACSSAASAGCHTSGLSAAGSAHQPVPSTKAGGTGRPMAAMRARLCALKPMASGGGTSGVRGLGPQPIRATAWAAEGKWVVSRAFMVGYQGARVTGRARRRGHSLSRWRERAGVRVGGGAGQRAAPTPALPQRGRERRGRRRWGEERAGWWRWPSPLPSPASGRGSVRGAVAGMGNGRRARLPLTPRPRPCAAWCVRAGPSPA